MRMYATERNRRTATWAPAVGLVATVGGILIAFTRIGTESQWETVLVGVGFSLVVTGAGLIVLELVGRGRQ
jgi:biopolymer transport protein ExbB/TolQ